MSLPENPRLEIEQQQEENKAMAMQQFQRFDVVADDSDHHYNYRHQLADKKDSSDCFSNASSEVHKKIMKEWKILQKNLPESIYVRVYEHRIDLLRAVIVGPPCSPYHDGLFFFDLTFPVDYPTLPPMVRYRSFGIRLNPNLYADGHVCLSLLNTWFGRTSEKWNPSGSTVLQVLVSIQGLVLNSQPYYNEPGVGIFPGRYKKSMALAYNENVFLLSCKSMLLLLSKPPKNFEEFVVRHFRERAEAILLACITYMDGVRKVGDRAEENGSSEVSFSPSPAPAVLNVSNNFRAAMGSLYAKLVEAFAKNGASVDHFVEQLRKANERALSSQGRAKKRSMGRKLGLAKVIGKIKKMLRLKKKVEESNV